MEKNRLLEHSYDGIQEYDNPLPGWWSKTFIAMMVFSFFYWMWYHPAGNVDRTLAGYYDAELNENTRLQFGKIGDLIGDDATLMRYANKKEWLRVGAGVFKTHCVSCHGRDGEGSVGPNLTDEFYKYVRQPEDVYTIVSQGAGKGAMPAWGTRLHPNELVLVSSYVISLRGKNIAGKGHDGNSISPWPAPPVDEPPSDKNAKRTEP